jgi:hypothetical protein
LSDRSGSGAGGVSRPQVGFPPARKFANPAQATENADFSELKRVTAVIGWFINFTSFPTPDAPESRAIS